MTFDELSDHLRTCKRRPVPCDICTSPCSGYDDLTRHLETAHDSSKSLLVPDGQSSYAFESMGYPIGILCTKVGNFKVAVKEVSSQSKVISVLALFDKCGDIDATISLSVGGRIFASGLVEVLAYRELFPTLSAGSARSLYPVSNDAVRAWCDSDDEMTFSVKFHLDESRAVPDRKKKKRERKRGKKRPKVKSVRRVSSPAMSDNSDDFDFNFLQGTSSGTL